MKIAYVCTVAAYAVDGVNDKVATQADRWRRAGHTVEVFSLTPAAEDPQAVPTLSGSIYPYRGIFERVRATRSLTHAVRELAPDIVYLRYDLYVPPIMPLFRSLPVIIELNTDDQQESRLDGRARWAYNEFNRHSMLRGAAGLVCVTHELAALPSVNRYGKPAIVIGNGADPEVAMPLAPSSGSRPTAVMLVGYPAAWAGVDKVLALAEALPGIDVHLVGRAPAATLPPNVHAHGPLARTGYRQVLARADFGLGPLALHRKGMDEASPLKVREYLLHGLPVVIAHTDTDFLDEDPWYLLRLPNCEGNVASNTSAIESWAAAIAGRRVPVAEVAVRLGVDGKEAMRLAFMEQVAHRPSPGAQ